jgi:hypothetical protein
VNSSLISGFLTYPTDIAISGTNLFVYHVISGPTGVIGSYGLDGTPLNASLVSGLASGSYGFGLALSGDTIFVIQAGTGSVGSYTTSGAPINASLITGLTSPRGIAVSDSYIYISTYSGTVRKYTIFGGLVNSSLISAASGLNGIAVNGTNVFLANGQSGTIGEYTTSGGTVNESFISGLYAPIGLSVSGTNLYISMYGIGPNGSGGGARVQQYSTSGNLVNGALITGLSSPYGVAVLGTQLPPPPPPPPPSNSLPTIIIPPESMTVATNDNATLGVLASGATSYQWRFNGTDIPGATSSTLTIPSAQVANSGYYMVVLKNDVGWVPSLPVYLSVVDIAGIVRFSNKTIPYERANYQYTVSYGSGGDGPITNGAAFVIAGPALDQMQPLAGTLPVSSGYFGTVNRTVPTVAAGQTAYFRVGITYPLSWAPGGVWTQLSTVLPLVAGGGAYPVPSYTNLYFPIWIEWPDYDPSIYSASPTNQLRIRGETFTLTCGVYGYGDLGVPTIQWRKDGKEIGTPMSLAAGSGYYATNATLNFNNLQPSDAGVYDIKYLGNNWIIGPRTILSILVTNGAGALQSPRIVGNKFAFDLSCAPRRRYVVQRSTNLKSWNDVQIVTNLLENQFALLSFTNNASLTAAFYRAWLLP